MKNLSGCKIRFAVVKWSLKWGMMSAFFRKYQFWFKCWSVVWGVLVTVFSFYMITFFLGNHDWQYFRYDMPLDAGIREARMTQFIPPWLFSLGRMLPIWNTVFGFMFLSGAAVLLAWWYGLKPKAPQVVLFSLLIGLHPYVCTSLYYAYLFLSFGCWHFLTVLGLVLAWQFVHNHKIWYFIGAMVCLWCALFGYAACVELIGVLVLGKLMIDCCASIQKNFIKKWMFFCLNLFVVFAVYVSLLKILQYTEILDNEMYNTQSLSIEQMISRFMSKWQVPFTVLNSDFPYIGRSLPLLFWGLVVVFNLTLWQVFSFVKFVLALFLEIGIFYATFAAAYISSFDVFYMFRVHAFSVPYLAAIMLAFIWLKGKHIYRNAAFAISICLVCACLKCDFMAQKVWYLGNNQNDKTVERIKSELLPQMEVDKHYRLSTLGNFYGCKKFADIRFVSNYEMEKYREFWGAPYFLGIFFSSGFFAYEAHNPIWGDSLYLPSWAIFYGITNESITPEQKVEASLFARYFGDNKSGLVTAVRRLRSFPHQPYIAIGEKDIILMLSDTQDKDLLVQTITED